MLEGIPVPVNFLGVPLDGFFQGVSQSNHVHARNPFASCWRRTIPEFVLDCFAAQAKLAFRLVLRNRARPAKLNLWRTPKEPTTLDVFATTCRKLPFEVCVCVRFWHQRQVAILPAFLELMHEHPSDPIIYPLENFAPNARLLNTNALENARYAGLDINT
jgi:hypothetical protein